MRILFATAEAWPLAKTGGLGDVCGSLPGALAARGHDVRLLLPAYPAALDLLEDVHYLAHARPRAAPPVSILGGRLPGDGDEVPVYLVDCPELYDRPGRPYGPQSGVDWPDNALRFTTLCRAAWGVALDRLGLGWAPDVVHAHDWHTGLLPALLAREPSWRRPATVFTIHNLAYQGLFPRRVFDQLELPTEMWSPDTLEFHGQLSFLKAGAACADRVTTVSPSYAEEIRGPALGCGLDGVLRARGADLVGILNGVDDDVWNPTRDTRIAAPYRSPRDPGKARNKRFLQRMFGLPCDPSRPLFAFLHRLVEQKGVVELLEALPELLRRDLQLVVVGEGEPRLSSALEQLAAEHPGLGVSTRYTEELAHQVIAGADALLMPSRFEPCGLTQLYALRYGTVPVVHPTGGLIDTVVPANTRTLGLRTATGLAMRAPKASALVESVDEASACYVHHTLWQQLQRAGMARDFSWSASAGQYQTLYQEALAELRPLQLRRGGRRPALIEAA